ncbi:MAG: hypothetical protein RSB25_23420, partial [Acinetobacter sp.]
LDYGICPNKRRRDSKRIREESQMKIKISSAVFYLISLVKERPKPLYATKTATIFVTIVSKVSKY